MSQKKPRHQGAKKPEYGTNKKAFDAVMKAYRDLVPQSCSIDRVTRPDNFKETGLRYDEIVRDPETHAYEMMGGSKVSNNPANPSPTDFKSDVEIILRKRIEFINTFREAYVYFDSIDVIEQEQHAEKVLGNGRHVVEQRLGADFIRKGLYPVQKYFTVERRPIEG